MSVSVIVRVFELVKCLLRMHSSSWIHTEVSGIKHAHRPTQRWTIEILQAHTRTHWHIHTHPRAAMPKSVRPDSLSRLLSATFIFTTTSWRIFHPACSQTFLRLGLRVRENVHVCLSQASFHIFWAVSCFCLSHTISFSLGATVVVFCALLMCAYTWQNVSVNVYVLCVPLSWYLINVPLFLSACVFVLL